MKNSILVRSAHNFETYIRNLQRQKQQNKESVKNKMMYMISENKSTLNKDEDESLTHNILKNDFLAAQKRPAARDGHTSILYTHPETEKSYMLVFGGDRH